MKKIILFIAASLLFATQVFAGSGATQTLAFTNPLGGSVYGAKGGAASATTPLIGKTSTGVAVGWNTAGGGYAIVTQHLNGLKAFGTSFDSTSIFTAPVTAGSAIGTSLTTGSDSFTASGSAWVTM